MTFAITVAICVVLGVVLLGVAAYFNWSEPRTSGEPEDSLILVIIFGGLGLLFIVLAALISIAWFFYHAITSL